MKFYKDQISQFQVEAGELSKRDRSTSILRFVVIVASLFLLYQGFKTDQSLYYISALLVFAAFLLLIRYHTSLRWNRSLVLAKNQVNQDEVEFLKGESSVFESGEEFTDPNHLYAYDLDFFGRHSLFQFINRTATYLGKKRLASSLMKPLESKEIPVTQEAVKELREEVEWRQHFLALARMQTDDENSFNELVEWAAKKPIQMGLFIKLISYVLPLVTIACFVVYFTTPYEQFWNIGLIGLVINLGVLGLYAKQIREELIPTTKIEHQLKQYSLLLHSIEMTSFKAGKLQKLKSQLAENGNQSSRAIHQLSLLFGRLEHVSNVFASPLLNGLFLYHVHNIRDLSTWRRKYATHIHDWLQVIAEFEQLNSLANLSYNYPEFSFPSINSEYRISFEDLGHPLLTQETAVTNSIDFNHHRFFILTGSNMSGKSTFLRSVGVNMVLASIGAPIVASKADIHPMPVLVSMRLSDSLTDSESYFYAEVKRLKTIMDQLDKGPCFVLLDEILRGTNSDDKRNGTIEVIQKMVEKKAYGGIATHDLEVCKVSDDHPDTLINKRFEVEIIDDELVFDYKLRDGICQNKSASFIMEKMGVI